MLKAIMIEHGHVEVWFLPGANCTADTPGPAVSYAHGDAELIEDLLLLRWSGLFQEISRSPKHEVVL